MREWNQSWWEVTDKYDEIRDSVRRVIYRNIETGEETSLLPYGALYVSKHGTKGYDGKSVVCIIPTSKYTDKICHWYIDSRASNCTMPNDTEHRCWVRHGTFCEEVHVDKGGNTCQAGAGSISVEGFHGFLHHGKLVEC
jgi:hypothetical protein